MHIHVIAPNVETKFTNQPNTNHKVSLMFQVCEGETYLSRCWKKR